ncbi:hypothetical protein [Rheinheimera tilapiae]|uniref:Uncharacterized protein n=1 Tax=Rheinheimera tilapiae TaxID=875043 RepID=A0ABV6BAB0_9GAMM
MHIIIMLALVIVGFAAGQNLTWLIGMPMIGIGLYIGFGDWGGKKGARQREQAESLFLLSGLIGMVVLIIAG